MTSSYSLAKPTSIRNREVSVDEAVKKFKGRCLFKQYIKGKPVRFGIKIFCLCCSATSYLFNAIFYIGKSDILPAKESSITKETVIQLMQPLAGKHHQVCMDDYYTCLPLFKELASMQILATGTVRTNRKGLDPYVTMKKSEEKALKKNPGSTRFSSCGRYVYVSWFDKRPVYMLSNCHQPVTRRRGGALVSSQGWRPRCYSWESKKRDLHIADSTMVP